MTDVFGTAVEIVRKHSADDTVRVGFDAIHANIDRLPPGQSAGYTTGTPDIRWTNDDFSDHPGAVHICQDVGTDTTADVLDVERGAATNSAAAVWVRAARASFASADRPGQRRCAVYTSASNVSPLVNTLMHAGIHEDVRLWVANWDLSEPQAVTDVLDAAGPFPIVGVQYSDGSFYDYDVFSGSWLTDVSGAINPVKNLRIVKRGWTGLTAEWDAAPGASSYSVHAFRTRSGRPKGDLTTSHTSARMGRLFPGHTYTIEVRAHPRGDVGADAYVNGTTRGA